MEKAHALEMLLNVGSLYHAQLSSLTERVNARQWRGVLCVGWGPCFAHCLILGSYSFSLSLALGFDGCLFLFFGTGSL